MTLAHLQSYKIISTFATLDKQGLRVCNISTHSSMDRIPDSGSDDWGSTPHGCTVKYKRYVKIRHIVFLYITIYYHFSRLYRYNNKGCIAKKLDATFVVYTDVYFLFHDTVATHEGID